MTVTDHDRQQLLQAYGRWYGQERFALAFTATTQGDNAKRVTTSGWDKTKPQADAEFAAGLLAKRGQTRNVAIVLRPSNLIVLECDTEDDLLRIQSIGLPETITVRSSKPYKRHFYFRPPEHLNPIPYVAFRFESGKLTADTGRYFLAPPSIHPSGAVYAFLPGHGPGEMDIAELPEAIYRNLAQKARDESEQQRERITVDPDAKIRAGQRGETLFRYACMLRRWGLPRQQILDACLQYNDDRCDPPIDRSRVEMQVDGAMKKRGDQELERAHQNPLPDPDEPEAAPEPERDSWTPLNLDTLDENPPIKPTLGHGGIAYPGKRHVFSGPQESAKTLAAYAIALELVRAGETVVIVDFEMGAYEARNRLRELGATPEDFHRLPYIEPDQPATPERTQALIQLKPALVIIDAAAGAYDNEGLDDNKRQDVEKFTRLYVRDFWKAGIATIVLDHVVKNTETRGKYAIGSERKIGGADVHLGFEVITPINRGTTGLYKITTHKDRGGYLKRGTLANLELHSHPDTHHITWTFQPAEPTEADEPWRPTILMERVSRYLEKHPGEHSFAQVLTNVKGKDATLKDALEHLIALEYVAETKGDRGSRQVRILRPYHDETPHEHKGAEVVPFPRQASSDNSEQKTGANPATTPKTPAQTDSLHALPTSAPPLPADVCPPLPTSAPPTRGQTVERAEEQTTTSAHADDPEVNRLLDLYGTPDDDLPL